MYSSKRYRKIIVFKIKGEIKFAYYLTFVMEKDTHVREVVRWSCGNSLGRTGNGLDHAWLSLSHKELEGGISVPVNSLEGWALCWEKLSRQMAAARKSWDSGETPWASAGFGALWFKMQLNQRTFCEEHLFDFTMSFPDSHGIPGNKVNTVKF